MRFMLAMATLIGVFFGYLLSGTLAGLLLGGFAGLLAGGALFWALRLVWRG